MAPIFNPPRSVPEAESLANLSQEAYNAPVQSFSPEQIKEAFDVARNSMELLSMVLSSSPQQDALKVNDFMHRIGNSPLGLHLTKKTNTEIGAIKMYS